MTVITNQYRITHNHTEQAAKPTGMVHFCKLRPAEKRFIGYGNENCWNSPRIMKLTQKVNGAEALGSHIARGPPCCHRPHHQDQQSEPLCVCFT